MIVEDGFPLIPGKIICKNLQKIPRNLFTSLEKRTDCQKSLKFPAELVFDNVGKPVDLSMSSFDSPSQKVSLKRLDFKQLCLQSIAPNFFGDFFDSSQLITLVFKNVRCLQDIQQNAFAGLSKLNTFRWIEGSVRKIEFGAFPGLSAIEEFTVSDTRLRDLPERLFVDSTSLTELTLSRNQIETVPATFFHFKAKKVKLDLSGNKIKVLPTGTFEKLHLEALDLSGNRLSSFTVEVLGKANQQSVNMIKLAENQLTDLSRDLVAGRNIAKFNLYVEGNPWNCACDLLWFKTFFGEGDSSSEKEFL